MSNTYAQLGVQLVSTGMLCNSYALYLIFHLVGNVYSTSDAIMYPYSGNEIYPQPTVKVVDTSGKTLANKVVFAVLSVEGEFYIFFCANY